MRLLQSFAVAAAVALSWLGCAGVASAQSTQASMSWYDFCYDFELYVRNPFFGQTWVLWDTYGTSSTANYYGDVMASVGYEVRIEAVYAPITFTPYQYAGPIYRSP